MNYIIITVLLLGAISGIGIGFLIFIANNSWVKFIFPTVSGSPFFVSFLLFHKMINIDTKDLAFHFALFLLSFLILVMGSLILLCFFASRNIQRIKGYKITWINFIRGDKKTIEGYYELLKNMVESDNETEKSKLDEVKEGLKQKEKFLYEKESELNNKINKEVHLELPIEQYVPTDQHFINMLPDYIKRISDFKAILREMTNKHIRNLETKRTKNKIEKGVFTKKDYIKGYLLELASYINYYICDSNQTRTHFRYLCNNSYLCAIASVGSKKYNNNITPMPVDKGLIYHAGEYKTSIISSLNDSGCSIKTKSASNLWVDFITMVFDQFYNHEQNVPLLSLTISVKSKEAFKELLIFLNFIKIERIIQEELIIYNNKLNIYDNICS